MSLSYVIAALLACFVLALFCWYRHQRLLRERAQIMRDAIRHRDFSFHLPTRGLFFGEKALQETLNDLGGEIEFSLDGEAHLLTKSTIIFAPAGIKHNPMRILRVDRPIFHFSVVTSHMYDGEATYR